MIKSMTGYGIGSAENGSAKYSVELKSLNSKFLELNVRLPKGVSDKELWLRSESAKLFERGKLTLTVSVEYTDSTVKASSINTALFKSYYEQLESLSQNVGSTNANIFELAINMPDVVSSDESAVDEEESMLLEQAFSSAAKNFNRFRSDEGTILKKDLEYRSNEILDLLDIVQNIESDRIGLIKERLSGYLDKAVGKENVDMNRFEQELIYYIDKFDITEEKVRLKSHCDYFVKTLNDSAGGKKLGFISQEMGREINTLGSKANNAEIQQIVVKMKEELEKIKEQLLNVL